MELVLSLMAHLVGDFFLQSKEMAEGKRELPAQLLKHCVIYASVMAALICFLRPLSVSIIGIATISFLHAFIDFSKERIIRKYGTRYKNQKAFELYVFTADQVAHLTTIGLIMEFLRKREALFVKLPAFVTDYINEEHLLITLIIAFLYMICLSPSGLLIKKALAATVVNSNTQEEKKNGSGYLIGILERLIILTLGLSGQLGSIGFVLTAKSLARFKQLEEVGFAERYLIGTLLSVLVSLVLIIGGNLALRSW